MKLFTLPLALVAVAVSASAQTSTIPQPTATVGTPSVTVNGSSVNVQFPVAVTLNVSSLSSGTNATTTTAGTTAAGTTSGTTGTTASAGTTAAGAPSVWGAPPSAVSTSSGNAASSGNVSPNVITTGLDGALNGFQPQVEPMLTTDISSAPADPFSTAFFAVYGPGHLTADFSMPYYVVNNAPRTPITNVTTASESDVLPVPITTSTPVEDGIEGCTQDGADHHAFIIDAATGFDYELYQAQNCNGVWSSYSTTLWDLTKPEQRPLGWTSADAAGLPIFPLLVRYDEVANGSINHALRITFPHTKTGPQGGIFVPPATHAAGDVWGMGAYTGMRIRLKANFDISGFSPANQVILTAMKKYGLVVADNGTTGMFQGTQDSRWNQDDLAKLTSVGLKNFEVIQMGAQQADNAVPSGNVPVISSFTATQSGSNTVLMWNVSGDSYDYIAEYGPVRGTAVSIPYVSGATYTLVSTNQFGRTTKAITIP